MKKDFGREDWERRLRPFSQVWDRVQDGRPFGPPPPPLYGPPRPPLYGPPPPPPLMPGKGCCSHAVRFNPHRRK